MELLRPACGFVVGCTANDLHAEVERMAYRISWRPDEGYVSILAPTAQDALLLSADFARKGLPAMVSELDGTPLTALDLELMIAAQSAQRTATDS